MIKIAFALLVASLTLLAEAAPLTNGQLDAEAFLAKTIARLQEEHPGDRNPLEWLKLTSTGLRERLDAELERRQGQTSEVERTELELLRELRHFLYGQLDSKLCQIMASDETRLIVQNLRPGSSLAKLVERSWTELARGQTKLSELILDKRLKQVEFCKPHWNKQLVELHDRLDEAGRHSMASLYNNLIAYEADRFASFQPNPSNAPDASDTALKSFEQFIKLLGGSPRAASFIVYMSRIESTNSMLKLDDNMQNSRLDRATFDKALAQGLMPTCQTICKHFRPVANHNSQLLQALNEVKLARKDEMSSFKWRLVKLFADQPAKVSVALVVQSACCKLTSVEPGESIRRQIFKNILGRR